MFFKEKLNYIEFFLILMFTILSLDVMLDPIIKSSLTVIIYEHLTKNPLFEIPDVSACVRIKLF